MNDQAIAIKGREAAQVLDSEVYKDAVKLFRQSFIDSLVKIPDEKKFDDDLRRAQMMVKMSYLFDGIFRGFVENGKVAQSNIDKHTLRDETPVRQFFRRAANG